MFDLQLAGSKFRTLHLKKPPLIETSFQAHRKLSEKFKTLEVQKMQIAGSFRSKQKVEQPQKKKSKQIF